VAGEACKEDVVRKHGTRLSWVRLVNEYGPTEATVWATADVLDAASTALGVSIGRPIPSMRLWLLNEAGVPAALGEVGEIHLGGPQLVRGYRSKPEQTAAAFVIRPDVAGEQRMYRTGDLARWRVDGRIAFLGRRDQQVKIRGHRIELAEIERTLASHDQVRDAAVVAQEHAGSTRLIAYVTGAHGAAPDPDALRGYLAGRLPAYMVPAVFVRMDLLPRSPNGKLDLQALPDPETTARPGAEYVAPRNPLEAQLAAICAEVLRLPRVGVEDNFFQIGGDSILSLQVVTRANQRGIQITAKQVFARQTVAAMAAVAGYQQEQRFKLDMHWQQSIDAPHALEAMELAASRYRMERGEVCAAVLYRSLTRRGRMRLAWVQYAGEDARAAGAQPYRTLHELHSDSDGWDSVLRAAKAGLRQLMDSENMLADAGLEVAMSHGVHNPPPQRDVRDRNAAEPLYLSASMTPDNLVLAWYADPRHFPADHLRSLARDFLEQLHELFEHCAATAEQQLSAEDFPSAGLDEGALQDLLAELASGTDPSARE
jgi:aryl carrier-like protein